MSNAPEHLYNIFMTYEWERLKANFNVFYTVKGDTLVAGAGEAGGNFIPSVYEKEYGTLNMSVSKKISEHGKVTFQVKNILNPAIQSVYRASVLPEDKIKTSFKKGVDYSLSVNFNW
jgi:outer membrane receptor for ferrienterochelin and colicin